MRRLLLSLACFTVFAFAGSLAFADSSTIDFESYSPGNIDGQDGWSKTGSYDVEIENVADYANASGFGFGTKALRISNAVTSGAFGDQAFAPQLTQPAGESGLGNFEVSFKFGSATGTQQVGLFNSFSPDDGNGGRMSYIGLDDQVDGIHVIFYDATNPGPLGSATSFNATDVATVNRTAAHTARLSMHFVSGPGNDVVRVFVDGVLEHTGTSWEDYYRYDNEQTGNLNQVPSIDTMLFRAGGTAAPATTGNGYLLDNLQMSSAAVTQCTTVCFVDDDGSDAAGGDTPATAKRHIQAAIDQVSSNGQVRVLPGAYSETAVGRTVMAGTLPNGPHQFGLFFDSAKPGVTVMGVTSANVAITDPNATEATVTTNATNNFGTSGIFVDANNTTIQGLEIGPNAAGDNKTIEVVADNFSLKYSNTSIPGGGGSIYINDWSDDGDVVDAYHILDNEFDDGTSVDISSGPGSDGPLAGREIKDNHFDLLDNGFNGVSFNGSGTAVTWFVNPVGGAVISGNSFENSTQYIRSRGTVVTSDFAWADWFNDNTFETAVMTGPDPANDSLTADAYDCGYGPGSCPNRMRIGATIQGEVNRAAVNDIVLVKEGDYTENVVAAVSGLTFKGPQYGVAFGGRTFDSASEATLEGQFGLQAADIKVDGFSIQHHVSIDDSAMGVYVKTAGSGATVSNNIFKNLISTGTGTQSRGLAIYLENGPDNVTISDNLIDGVHGKVSSQGILVGDSGATNSSTGIDITNNTIKNITSDTKGAYGIQSNNAVGGEMDIVGNTISNLTASAAGGWIHAIGLENDTPNTTVNHNVIHTFSSPSANQVAVWFEDPNGVYQTVPVNRNSLDVGPTAYGIYVHPSTPANGDVNGTCNWWGDADGPGSTAGSDVSTKVTVAPWLLSGANLDAACAAITVNSDAANISGAEGTLQSRSGSFNGSIDSITADNGSVGLFTDNLNGTWSWTYTPTDNHGPITINVTGHGSNGTTAVDTFTTTSTNANPTATGLNAPASHLYGSNFAISLTSPTDPSSVDAGSLHYAFDCGSGYSASTYAGASTTNSASCPAPAQSQSGEDITVKGKVFDKDGGSNEYTANVEILQPEISLTPPSHNYGTAVTGSTTAPSPFVVENVGTSDLTISSVGLGGTNPGHFGIDSNGCFNAVLEPGETCTIDVVFHPTSNGPKSALLQVGSNDPNVATEDSSLTGSGGNAPAPGTIRIVLDTLPNSGQDFVFNGDLGTFTLDDDSNATRPRLRMFTNLSPGTYDVTQSTDPSIWSLTSISCTTSESTNVATRTATIDLGAGEEVVCTFVDARRRPDGLISQALNGTYKGGNVYRATAISSQTQRRKNVAANHTYSYFVRAQNDSLRSDKLRLDASESGSAAMSVTYWVDGINQTSSIVAGTYVTTDIAAGAFKVIEIRVAVAPGAPGNASRTALLAIRSDSKPAQIDVVRAVTSR